MGEDGVGEDLYGGIIHDWFGNCKVGWVGGFFANSGSFSIHGIHDSGLACGWVMEMRVLWMSLLIGSVGEG
jgi:hypothetical protein